MKVAQPSFFLVFRIFPVLEMKLEAGAAVLAQTFRLESLSVERRVGTATIRFRTNGKSSKWKNDFLRVGTNKSMTTFLPEKKSRRQFRRIISFPNQFTFSHAHSGQFLFQIEKLLPLYRVT